MQFPAVLFSSYGNFDNNLQDNTYSSTASFQTLSFLNPLLMLFLTIYSIICLVQIYGLIHYPSTFPSFQPSIFPSIYPSIIPPFLPSVIPSFLPARLVHGPITPPSKPGSPFSNILTTACTIPWLYLAVGRQCWCAHLYRSGGYTAL
jgi:hypothetical protein